MRDLIRDTICDIRTARRYRKDPATWDGGNKRASLEYEQDCVRQLRAWLPLRNNERAGHRAVQAFIRGA